MTTAQKKLEYFVDVIGGPRAVRRALGLDPDALEHEPTTNCTPQEDMVRPEFQQSQDINRIMRRFLETGELATRHPIYGEVDMDVTPDQAHLTSLASRHAWDQHVPKELRRKYANWGELAHAMALGHVRLEADTPPAPPAPPAPPPPPAKEEKTDKT